MAIDKGAGGAKPKATKPRKKKPTGAKKDSLAALDTSAASAKLALMRRNTKHHKLKPQSSQSSTHQDADDSFVFSRSSQPKVSTPEQQLKRPINEVQNDKTSILLNDISPKRRKATTKKIIPDNSDDDDEAFIESSLHFSKRKQGWSPDVTVDDIHGRRSSYHNRGRVLEIENYAGEIHKDVPVNQYYKSLRGSPNNKMRQLLIWCLKKQIQNNFTNIPDSDLSKKIAKVILNEMIVKLQNREIPIDLESKNLKIDNKLYEKINYIENPINIQNLKDIEKYKLILQDIKRQKQDWQNSFLKLREPIINPIPLKDLPDQPIPKQYYHYLDSIEKAKDETKKIFEKELPQAADKLYHTAYKMTKLVELVDEIKLNHLEPKVSEFLTDRITNKKPLPEKFSDIGWQHHKIDMVDILRAIPLTEELDIQDLKDI